jgi:hypothetical protein
MSIMSTIDIVNDIFERIASEASRLASYNKKSAERSGLLCIWCCVVSLPSTPYLREPKPLPDLMDSLDSRYQLRLIAFHHTTKH